MEGKKIKIIEFNEKLKEYGRRWLENTPKKFSDYEDIKKEYDLIYNTWADLPADWLKGLSPREYFRRIENPEELIDLLLEYADRLGEEIPRVLFERFIEMGDKAIKPLLNLASNEDLMLINSRGKGHGPIKAVQLLGELKTPEAIPVLIKIIQNGEEFSIITDTAVEALVSIGEEALEQVTEALLGSNDERRSYFAEILGKIGRDEKTFQLLVKFFEDSKTDKMIYANSLGDFGDPRAIPFLEKALADESLNYFEFREIKGVIEELGGVVNIERDFSDDEWFQVEKEFGQLQNIFQDAEMIKGYGLYEGIEWERGAGNGLGNIGEWEDEEWTEDEYWSEGKPVPVRVEKIGRNDPCPCGSGKKYKKCCYGK